MGNFTLYEKFGVRPENSNVEDEQERGEKLDVQRETRKTTG
jgi:hypothetical protein